jgi:hypothetical protein
MREDGLSQSAFRRQTGNEAEKKVLPLAIRIRKSLI